ASAAPHRGNPPSHSICSHYDRARCCSDRLSLDRPVRRVCRFARANAREPAALAALVCLVLCGRGAGLADWGDRSRLFSRRVHLAIPGLVAARVAGPGGRLVLLLADWGGTLAAGGRAKAYRPAGPGRPAPVLGLGFVLGPAVHVRHFELP